jgi:hypothetical protein
MLTSIENKIFKNGQKNKVKKPKEIKKPDEEQAKEK